MFVTFKKNTIIIFALILASITAFSCIVFAVASESEAKSKNGLTIVIDAGHGGIDGGVTGIATNVKESDINLAISRSLKHFLVSAGYNVVMTRSTTDGLYGMATKNRKIKDMEARKTIINDAKPDLVVSVHQNSYPRPQEKGVQVFYAPNSEEGKRISDIIQSVLNPALNSTRSAKSGDYYILQCSPYPSMIIECGFLSNYEEEKLLITSSYQEKVAYSIFTGIQAILMSNATATS